MKKRITKKSAGTVSDFWIIPKKERKKLTDSLLIDSGQIAFEGTYKGVRVAVVVCGEVRLVWKGEVYKTASQYPEDLEKAIRTHRFEKQGGEIGANNWYELRVYKDKHSLNEVDVLNGDCLVEMDLNKMSDREAKEVMSARQLAQPFRWDRRAEASSSFSSLSRQALISS